ncbi:MAG: hypothetical protein ACYDDO_13880 [Acidiferrobacterales bacterium]
MAQNTGLVLAVALSAVEPPRVGTACALANTDGLVGAALGVAVVGAVYVTAAAGTRDFTPAMQIGSAVAFWGMPLATLIIGC